MVPGCPMALVFSVCVYTIRRESKVGVLYVPHSFSLEAIVHARFGAVSPITAANIPRQHLEPVTKLG